MPSLALTKFQLKMTRDAVAYTSKMRDAHAAAISQTSYRMRDGQPPTSEEVMFAINMAKQYDALLAQIDMLIEAQKEGSRD